MMAIPVLFLSVTLGLVGLSMSHMPYCVVEDIEVQPNFELSRMEGRWFEIQWSSFEFVPEEYRFRDYEHHYTINMRTGGLEVIAMGRPTVNEDCFYYTGSLSLTDEPGKLLFTRADNVVGNPGTKTTPYWVVATDYNNYAVTYGCSEIQANGTCDSSKIESWVWSRNSWLSSTDKSMVDMAIQRICMKPENYLDTPHGNECPRASGAGKLYSLDLIVVVAILSFLLTMSLYLPSPSSHRSIPNFRFCFIKNAVDYNHRITQCVIQ